MTEFIGGEVVVPFTARISDLEKKARFAERILAKRGERLGRTFTRKLDREIQQTKLGSILTNNADKGFKTKRLATQKSSEFTSNFNDGTKGLFKGINFSALSFGLNIATLAFNTIADSIKKAEQREADFKTGMDAFNTTLIANSVYLSESARLNELVGNTAIRASDKIALLRGEYVSLEDRLNKISSQDKFARIQSTIDNSGSLFAQLEQRKGELEVIQSTAVRRPLTTFEIFDKKKIESEIRYLESQIRAAGKSIIDIFKGESPAALQAKLLNEGLRAQFQLQQDLIIAQNKGEDAKAQSIIDEINRISLRNKFIRANIDEYDELSRAYIEDQQTARKQGELKRQSLETVSRLVVEAAQNERAAQLERNAELDKAEALYKKNRTSAEQYSDTLTELSELKSKIDSDPELEKTAGGAETIQREIISNLLKYAQVSKDATSVFEKFDTLQKENLITTKQATGVYDQLNAVLGITAQKEKDAAAALEEENKRREEKAFLIERAFNRELELARLANDNGEIVRLERELTIRQKIEELKKGGISDQDRAAGIANREIAEEDVSAARGVFRSGFSDGLRAAIDGDLGSFLEDKLKDLASGMFDRAVENLADAVFDQLAQIAPGFLGQITGNANLPQSLSGAAGAATNTVGGVANQVAGAGTQAAGSAGTATAITTALSTGGATLATSVTAAMTTGGTTTATAIGTSMTTAGAAVAAQIAAAMASGGVTTGLSNFAGPFATGGVIGTGKFGLVGENGPELISAGSGPLRITPIDGGLRKQLDGFSTNGLVSRGSNQSIPSNVVMNIAGVKDLASFVKSQGTIEADMAAAMRRAQSDF